MEVEDLTEFHRDTQPKRTGTVEMGILIPTYARTPPQGLRDADDAVTTNSSGVAAVLMAVDAGSPAEVAANTPAKMLREVGGVKGAMSPSLNAQSHRKR